MQNIRLESAFLKGETFNLNSNVSFLIDQSMGKCYYFIYYWFHFVYCISYIYEKLSIRFYFLAGKINQNYNTNYLTTFVVLLRKRSVKERNGRLKKKTVTNIVRQPTRKVYPFSFIHKLKKKKPKKTRSYYYYYKKEVLLHIQGDNNLF